MWLLLGTFCNDLVQISYFWKARFTVSMCNHMPVVNESVGSHQGLQKRSSHPWRPRILQADSEPLQKRCARFKRQENPSLSSLDVCSYANKSKERVPLSVEMLTQYVWNWSTINSIGSCCVSASRKCFYVGTKKKSSNSRCKQMCDAAYLLHKNLTKCHNSLHFLLIVLKNAVPSKFSLRAWIC